MNGSCHQQACSANQCHDQQSAGLQYQSISFTSNQQACSFNQELFDYLSTSLQLQSVPFTAISWPAVPVIIFPSNEKDCISIDILTITQQFCTIHSVFWPAKHDTTAPMSESLRLLVQKPILREDYVACWKHSQKKAANKPYLLCVLAGSYSEAC